MDITVSHPLRPSEARPTPEKARKALVLEEQLKCNKYQVKCATAGWSFKPLAMHPFVGMTANGVQFLHRLSRLYAENTTVKPTRSEKVAFFWHTFTVTVMKEVTRQLRLTTYTGPQGPMIPYAIPVDEAGNEVPLTLGGHRLKRHRPQGQHCPYTGQEGRLVMDVGTPVPPQ